MPSMKMFLVSIFFLFSCGKKENLEKAIVKVPSSICGECVKTISTATMKVDGVKSISVNTETKLATFEIVSGTTLDAIEKAIVMAGYDANDKKADKDAYEKLPDCCKK